MTERIDSALGWATEQISNLSESPRLDAELLLAHCLDKPRSYLYTWPEQILENTCWQEFQQLVSRRLLPTPVAYLLGNREFYDLEFSTSPAALVPRPETELLIEQALSIILEDKPIRALDLGTGTGIIAITLKKHRPLVKMTATDVDPQCLELARVNAGRHAVDIDFILSSWFDRLEADPPFDIIVSNPPYIAAEHPFMAQGDLPAEPALALTPGATGLEALEIIIPKAPGYLSPGGYVIVEHGYDQQAGVASLFRDHGFNEIACHFDLNDLPRITRAKLVDNGGRSK